MHALTVNITRVFDTIHAAGPDAAAHMFSIELDDGRKWLGLRLDTVVPVRPGRWTFFLTDPDNPHSTVAMRDESTGTVYREHLFMRLVWPLLEVSVLALIFAFMLQSLPWLSVLIVAAWLYIAFLYVRKNSRVTAAIGASAAVSTAPCG